MINILHYGEMVHFSSKMRRWEANVWSKIQGQVKNVNFLYFWSGNSKVDISKSDDWCKIFRKSLMMWQRLLLIFW